MMDRICVLQAMSFLSSVVISFERFLAPSPLGGEGWGEGLFMSFLFARAAISMAQSDATACVQPHGMDSSASPPPGKGSNASGPIIAG